MLPLFESAVLIDHAARQLNAINDDPAIPFAIRMGIDFGVARKLSRRIVDYLGASIDRLSRIMMTKSERTSLVIEERAFDINCRELDQYKSIVEYSEPMTVSLPASKAVGAPIIYREILFRSNPDKPFTDYFVEWRKSVAPPGEI
jgi:hypothetical protein